MSDVKNSGLATGLVSYLELEEASGTRVDSHGSYDLTQNGTVTSLTAIQGDGAVYPGGTGNYLKGSTQTLGFSNSHSVSMWFKADSFTTNPRLFFVQPNSGSGNNITFVPVVTGSASYQFRNPAGTIFKNYNAPSGRFVTGTWYHFSATWDGTTLKIYVDGSEETWTKTTDGTGTMSDTSRSISVGATNVGTAPFDGMIDEVGLWSRSLTSTEVSDLYNSGAGIPYEATGGAVKPNYLGFSRL